MKIAQITPGLIEIPPKKWGAIEKIIWNYKIYLEKKGNEVDILYLDDVIKNYKYYDIVHLHVANLCQDLIDNNIPYYFTMHDHHVYLFRSTYEINRKAIDNAVKAFVPSKNLVDLFNRKPYYLSHGVSSFYELTGERKLYDDPKLLCLGNNVYSHTNDHDRKGFGLAIETAKKMNLSITVAGPYRDEAKSNKIFFDKLSDDLKYYDNLNVVKNPSEEKIVELYHSHDIFVHPSELEAGHPNLTLLEAAASKIPIVGVIEDDFPGIYRIERGSDKEKIIQQLINGIGHIVENYNNYVYNVYNYFYKTRKWNSVIDKLINFYTENENKTGFMKDILTKNYNDITIKRNVNNNFFYSFDKRGDIKKFDFESNFYDDLDSSVQDVYNEVFVNNVYDKYNLIGENSVVLDVGANIGMFTLFASKRGAETIIAVEPEKNNFNLLVKNRPLNSILYHRAVTDKKDNNINIHIDSVMGGHSVFGEDINGTKTGESQSISTITLDNIIEENDLNHIDVLKIDVEGSEDLVFKGISEDNLRKVKYIVLEYHNMKYNFDQDKMRNFISNITSSGFSLSEMSHLDSSNHLKMMYFMNNNKEQNRDSILNADLAVDNYFINGAFTELKGGSDKIFTVRHIDERDEEIVYEDQIKTNHWVKSNRQYYTPYRVEIYEENKKTFSTKLNLKGKRVYIAIDSSSLGDTLAWFPFVEEFRLKHDCEVFVSTFWNFLFDKNYYSKLNFIEPGVEVENIYAQYTVGIHGDGLKDKIKNPVDTRKVPLQKIASEYLGVDFKEIRPVLNYKQEDYNIKENKITFAIHATAQAKYWNNPKGWEGVADYLNEKGIKPILISKEKNGFMNNEHPPENKIVDKSGNYAIDDRIKDILESTFFMGIPSGLAWLAWALRKYVILIGSFTDPWYEFGKGVYRLHNNDVCHGCWHRHIFDKGDWFWCPDQKDTDRQFECSVSITPKDVINVIEKENLLD